MAEIKGLAAPTDEATGQQRLHRHRPGRHLAALAIVEIGGAAGVALVQRQPERGEVIGERDRMAPGHVAVEADDNDGQAADDHAHRVIPPGHGQVRLIEAVGRRPRKMRVTEQEPAPIGRQVLAHRQRIAAEALPIESFQLRHQRRWIDLARRGPGQRHGGTGNPAGSNKIAGKRLTGRVQRLFRHHQHHIVERDRPHPFGVGTGRRQPGASILQIAVIAFDIAFEQFARLAWTRGIPGA